MALDAASAVDALLENAGYTTFFALPDGLPDGPVVWIQKVGGLRNGFLALDRLQIAVIAPKRQQASEVAQEILDMIIERHHFVPGHGLIDSVEAESTPVEVPFKDNRINFIFNVAVHSRIS